MGSELKGQSALVTGGGSGIGLACARRLVVDGATVTICGRTEARLRDAAREIGAEWVVCDVTDEASVAAAVTAASATGGGLHIVVANAGGGRVAGPLVLNTLEGWNDSLAVNLTGTFLVIKHAAPVMARSGGGSIVAMSSIAGALTHRQLAAYCVAKAGIEMLVRNAADELGVCGIRVNAVRPGLVPTDASGPLVVDEETRADYIAQMPLGRIGRPDEIAGAVRFLAGDEAAWITGQVFAVDGGHTLRRGPDVHRLFDPYFREDFERLMNAHEPA
jgi:NAD(P)-dependent dehydrogenase (short-subunit alcohol dehydrogenase family)